MENHIIENKCTLCGINKESKCTEEKHKKHGFCLSSFTNFETDNIFNQIDDSVKEYLNTQAIIF